ncbi:hypothetical protein WJX72_008012 [[Myrmecia] bisecta]|uniref:Protein kinase domain-containing protein n=1 Tax=[Myrmecia] bisecta TaxID=41462 RepID=A0AAW1QRQ0_9CHLO
MIAAISHCTTRGPSHGLGWPDAGATRAGSSGLPGLDAATLQAVKQWQKLPGRKPSYPRNVSVNPCCPPKMHRLDPWKVQDYKLLRQIGHGRASVVYHGICLISHQTVAVKVYQKDKLSDVTRRQVEREIEIHSRVHHQHIIDLYAVFEDESSIYMVEEFAARGDLMQEKKARGGHMTEHQVVRDVLQPFLSTLNFLHSQGIVHRDIKPENLLFTANGTLKVTDFGTAIDLRRERAVSRLGTLDYMAPEILRCPNKLHPAENKENTDIHYNTHVDNWAVGVLAYELLVGRPPFEKESIEQTLQEIMQREPDIPSWLSEECQDFISQCLRKDAAQRPTVVQLLKHPWTTVLCHDASQAVLAGLA